MKESKRRPARLKGVVLVMVVTLLFVLIVMLMATLTVVGNANKRTVTKFEENQAYYTARSALGVYITGMLEMDETADLGENGAKRAADALKSKFTDVSSSQLNVFYKNKTDSSEGYADFGGKSSIVEGFVYQQELFGYLTPKYKLKNKDEAGNDLKRGEVMTAAPGSDSNWEENDDAIDNNKYFVKYKVKVPDVNSVTGMGSNGNVGVMATEDVDVTVELLRMVYLDKDDKLITDGVMAASNADGAAKILDVDWSKTYYRVKVTSTAKIKQGTGGVNEGTVSVILEPKVVNSPSAFKNALISFANTTAATNISTAGGGSAAGDEYHTPNNGAWLGSYVYQYNKVNLSSQIPWKLKEKDSFVVQNGWINVNNNGEIVGEGSIDATSEEDLAKRPYIYTGGMMLPSSDFKIGSDSDHSIDLILYNSFNTTKDMKSALDSNFVTKIESIGEDKIPGGLKADRIAYYDNGSSNARDIYGDVYCDGDMYIGCKTKFHGNVYCTGNIIVMGDANEWKFEKGGYIGGDIYKVNIWSEPVTVEEHPNKGTNAATVHAKDTTMQSLKQLTADGTECPWGNKWSNGSGENGLDSLPKIKLDVKGLHPNCRPEIEVPTVKTITETYRQTTGDPIPAEAFLKQQTKQDKIKLTVNNSAPYFTPSSMTGKNKDFTIDGASKSLTNVLDPKEASVATYNSQTDFYEMKLNLGDMKNNGGKTYYLDATEGNIQIELSGSCDAGGAVNLVVVGDSDVIFTVPNTSGGNQTLVSQLNIYNYESYNKFNSGGTFDLGKPPATSTQKAPKIYYYIDKDINFQMSNGSSCVMCGYMYGPEAKFTTTSDIGRSMSSYTYNGEPSTKSLDNVFCVGSMVFHEIDTGGSHFSVAFIDPGSSGGGAPTEGKVIWKRQRYLNR